MNSQLLFTLLWSVYILDIQFVQANQACNATTLCPNESYCNKGVSDPDGECKPCDDRCDGCIGEGNLNCKACDTSFLSLDRNATDHVSCYAQCPTGYYNHTGQCKQCRIDNCDTCKLYEPEESNLENYFLHCKRYCSGYNNNTFYSDDLEITTCNACANKTYLYKPRGSEEFCQCCVSTCPDDYTRPESGRECIPPTLPSGFCKNKLCPIIFAIVGGLLALVVLLGLIICICCRCKRNNKKLDPTKLPPSVHDLTAVSPQMNNNKDEDASSHDSNTVSPLLPPPQPHQPVSQTVDYANNTVHIQTTPPTPPPKRQDDMQQEVYENVDRDGPQDNAQEVYVNVEEEEAPSPPPRKDSKNKEPAKQDYVNKDIIEELAASNPHLKSCGLSTKQMKQDVPPPSPRAHKAAGNKGYANQEVIDKHLSGGSTKSNPEGNRRVNNGIVVNNQDEDDDDRPDYENVEALVGPRGGSGGMRPKPMAKPKNLSSASVAGKTPPQAHNRGKVSAGKSPNASQSSNKGHRGTPPKVKAAVQPGVGRNDSILTQEVPLPNVGRKDQSHGAGSKPYYNVMNSPDYYNVK